MFITLLTVCVFGLLVLIDRTVAMQSFISRPIVTGPILGTLLGQPEIGAAVGAILEFLWCSWLPLGGVVPPNETLATVLAVGGAGYVANKTGQLFEPSAFFLLISMPFAILSRRVEIFLRRLNVQISHRAEEMLSNGGPTERAPNLNLFGAALAAFVYALLLVPTAALVIIGGSFVYKLLPDQAMPILRSAYFITAGITAAALVAGISTAKSKPRIIGAFFAGLLLAALLSGAIRQG